MERSMLEKQNRMLSYLAQLPRRMIHIHGRDNMSEFLLHELCSEPCFNLRKAAYFVDNPDFNCLRGITGVSRDQSLSDNFDIWKNPDKFSDHMSRASFNNQVRSITHQSIDREASPGVLKELAQVLGLGEESCSWKMRHDNNGILMYEKADPEDAVVDHHLLDGMTLLSFCPIF